MEMRPEPQDIDWRTEPLHSKTAVQNDGFLGLEAGRSEDKKEPGEVGPPGSIDEMRGAAPVSLSPLP